MDTTELQRFQMHDQDVPSLLAHQATHRGDHPAVIWDPRTGSPRQWTYEELWEDVRALAVGLRDRGIEAGDKVLIHAENCPELVLSWLACATLGAVAVTTNTKSVAEEVGWFVDKARCVAAITQPQYAALVSEAAPGLKWVVVTEDNSGDPASEQELGHGLESFASLSGDAARWQARPTDPLAPFGIMFTSGTTSKPKAVVHTHANAVWASRTGPRNIDLGPDDRYLIYLPFFHVNAQSWSLFPVLGVGATAVVMPKWSASRFWEVVVRRQITHISLMPFCMSTLMAPDRPESALRVGVFGLIMPEGRTMFGLDVYAAYGMTETVIHSITAKPMEHLPFRSMGHVTPGYEIAVVDKESGVLCGEGQTGELWLRGTRGIQLFLEYFDNPEANEASFEDGWFKTGDMVRVDAGGNVFYVERDKDLLKVGGENVSAREVEDVVGTVAGVAQVAVVGKRHDFLDQVPVAFVVAAPGAPHEEQLERDVIAAATGRLASFKVPRAVYVVDGFPLGTLDKVLKSRLREMADERPIVP
jgi:carnitine-CoA ligase